MVRPLVPKDGGLDDSMYNKSWRRSAVQESTVFGVQDVGEESAESRWWLRKLWGVYRRVLAGHDDDGCEELWRPPQ
jgi:hypothetical protein